MKEASTKPCRQASQVVRKCWLHLIKWLLTEQQTPVLRRLVIARLENQGLGIKQNYGVLANMHEVVFVQPTALEGKNHM